MRISVIIPAFNEEKLIGACLQSVRAAFAGPGEAADYEIVVCDNASTDRTAAIAGAAAARVVFEPLRQIAAARNTGAAAATGDWFLFIDSDSVLSAGTLSAARALMLAGKTAGGGAVVRFAPAPPWWGLVSVAAWNAISRLFSVAAGSFIFCRADAFRSVGGFSRLLYAGEELALSRDIKRWGRARGLGFSIITSSAHVSSSRKFGLYGFWRLAGFGVKLLLSPWKSVKDPDRLPIFYNSGR